ncbi:MAG: histidine kinase dimerization/phospho-acceptor domain-containing protein [Burkholderiaceae bacterium]
MTRFLLTLRSALRSARPGWPRASLRTYMVAMLLIATVPLALLHLHSLRAQDTRVDHELRRTAIALAAGVEHELQASVDALNRLGTSATLQVGGDPGRLRADLQQRTLARSSWQGVFLTSADGTVLFDTAMMEAAGGANASIAPPEPGPRAATHAAVWPAVQAVLEAREPAISNLVMNARSGHGSTLVAVPVSGEGAVRYVLGAWIDGRSWQTLLEAAAPPPAGVLSLFDRNHRLIARTRATAPALGQTTLPRAAIESMAGHEQGVGRSSWSEDGDSRNAWRRVGLGHWGVGVELSDAGSGPAENKAVVRTLWALGLWLFVGLWLAVLLARWIVEPLAQLGGIDNGAPTPPRNSPVREIEALQERLRVSRVAEAERASRATDEFLARLGHELRNPLAALSSAVDVLNSPGTSAELTATARDIATRQTRNLASMLDDLMDPARRTAGKVRRADLEPPPVPAVAPEHAGTPGGARHRILLIADHADADPALQASLALDGHELLRAGDGTTGLALLLAERPDATIVDLGLTGLTGLTGFDVALRSRAAGYPGLMVATTIDRQEAARRRALQSGYDALLVKPVDAAQLRALLAGID